MSLTQIFIPFFEIFFITIFVYYLLSFFWNTRSRDLLLGIIAFFLFYITVNLLDLPVLKNLMFYFANASVLAILIIFQPEIRLALSRLAFKGKKYRAISEFDKFLEAILHGVYSMAESKIGALILLENQDSLDEFAQKAVPIHAAFSSELLESIFNPTTPLHDGGVIIRETTLLCAAAILPLAEESPQLVKTMGTRHRAALGVSQITDALVIVVSEETGKVALARDGIITRGVKPDRFKAILRSVFTSPQQQIHNELTFMDKIRQWIKRT
jgi:diadenylate cyclase